MAKKVQPDTFGEELTHIVQQFIKDENRKCAEIMPKVARVGRRSLRTHSPGAGPYANGWRTEWEDKYQTYYGFAIWNPKNYQLTHLLENGHLIKNQFGGPFGKTRTSAHPHISIAQNDANEKVWKLLKDKL